MRPASAEASRVEPRERSVGRSSAWSTCPHCGALVEGSEAAFCCSGCEAAHAIIHGAGLEHYYATRTKLPPRPESRMEHWDQMPVESRSDGLCEVRLAIDGLRCASCVWVAEKVLERTEGVTEASVSYATGRASLVWDPTRTTLSELAGRISTLGYRPRLLGSDASPDRSLLLRLGVAAFATSNVMMFSAALYLGWLGPMEDGFAELFRWSSLVLATPVAIWSAAPFFETAWNGLRARVLHMDVPIAIAVAVLYGQGVYGTLAGVDTYLDSLTMLVTLLLAGRLAESGGRRRTTEAAVALAATVPITARVVTGESMRVVRSADLQPGDRIAIGAGEDVPADGIVNSGRGALRRALVTGESEPVTVQAGDEVWAGTVLTDGAILVDVQVHPSGTVVERMAEELRAAAGRAMRPDSVDRVAPWFTAGTLLVAALTFLGWLFCGGAAVAMEATIAVLVVACPCALALSRPLVAAAGLGAAARRGLLFRSPEALLRAADVDTVALDKTGTVSEGATEVVAAADADLRVAAGLERYSRHPVGVAIVREAVARGIPLPTAEDVRECAGTGIAGRVDGIAWTIGRGGAGEVVLRGEDGQHGVIRTGDRTRPDSRSGVDRLRRLGLRTVLLTGDLDEPTRDVAGTLGGIERRAAMTPVGKARLIEEWQREGRVVLFAGDGLNDGPALAAADVAVAMGTGAASSILVADAVLARATIEPLAAGIEIGRVCRRAVRASQRRSIAYNVLAVGAAAAGWVNPLVAAILMPLSSAMVLAGAARVESSVRRAEGR